MKPGLILTNTDLTIVDKYSYKLVIEKWIDDCIEGKIFKDLSETEYKFKNDQIMREICNIRKRISRHRRRKYSR